MKNISEVQHLKHRYSFKTQDASANLTQNLNVDNPLFNQLLTDGQTDRHRRFSITRPIFSNGRIKTKSSVCNQHVQLLGNGVELVVCKVWDYSIQNFTGRVQLQLVFFLVDGGVEYFYVLQVSLIIGTFPNSYTVKRKIFTLSYFRPLVKNFCFDWFLNRLVTIKTIHCIWECLFALVLNSPTVNWAKGKQGQIKPILQ